MLLKLKENFKIAFLDEMSNNLNEIYRKIVIIIIETKDPYSSEITAIT